VLELADYAIRIEDHYCRLARHPTPMDIEWAKDGEDGKLYIVQTRPETAASNRQAGAFEIYSLNATGPVLASGRSVGEKIAAGSVRVIPDARELSGFKPGRSISGRDDTPRLGAGHEDRGSDRHPPRRAPCHAAIVARELGIPAVAGAEAALENLESDAVATVSCTEGETGKVYAGSLPFRGGAGLARPGAAATHRDHGQPRQPQTRLSHGDAAQ
jgi:pyruvate, water dikinase